MAHLPEQGFKLQLLAVALIAILVFLHYLLWIGEDGVRQTHTLRISIRAQTDENGELTERNRALMAEIEDLKRGLMAIEERARADMGMIRPDETFYRLLEKPLSPQATPNKPTPPAKPPAPTAKPPAPAAKPPAPAAKPPAPTAKPPAPAAKPATP
ncbi:MAG: cell division protein FtsB [Candidatus Contendobacter sp.]|nr:cell division protein FtsB [Candidatus Contendobacter sp.]